MLVTSQYYRLPVIPNPYLGQYLLAANALDSTSNHYDLTTVGTITYSNVGGFNCAGGFISDSDYLTAPAGLYNAFNASNNWEIECDVQFSRYGTYNTIVCFGGNDFFGTEIGSGLIAWNDGNGPGGYFTGSTSPSLNTWYNIKFTWDGVTRKIYVNGVLDGSLSTSGQTSGSVMIGRHPFGTLPLTGYLRNLTFKLV